MSLSKITCPSCGASTVKHIPLQVKFATCHKCGYRFDIWKEGITPDIEAEKNLPISHNSTAMDRSSGGWLKLALIYTVCIYSLLFVMVANNTRHSPGWPNSLEFLVSLLYVPTILLTAIMFLVLVAKAITTRQVSRYLIPLFLCTPMIAYSLYNPGHAYDKSFFRKMDKIEANNRFKIEMAKALDAYYKISPESFHYIGSDCEITVDGFAEYVGTNHKKIREFGAEVKKDKIIDPWGKPVRFIRDRFNDRIIRANGKVAEIPYWSGDEIDNPEGLGIINTTDDPHHEPFSILMNQKYREWYVSPNKPYGCNKCDKIINTKPRKNSDELICPNCGTELITADALQKRWNGIYDGSSDYYLKTVPIIDKTEMKLAPPTKMNHALPKRTETGIYKSVDKDGNITFSDDPSKTSQK